MTQYIMKYPDNKNYVGLDRNSGGYPYKTNWNHAQCWTDLDEALKYKKHFPEDKLKIFKVQKKENQINFIPVSDTILKNKLKESALAKLTDEDKKILGL